MFRELNKTEAAGFRQWARDNYRPQTEINPVWHPVVQAECRRINEEAAARTATGSNKTETK